MIARSRAAWTFVAGVAVAVALLILLRPAVPIAWDQSFIGYEFHGGYPHLEAGIVSHLLVGLVNAIVPFEPTSSNTLIRVLAALLYVISAGLLAWSVTGADRWWGFLTFVLLVVTSGFPFLWLSSELFAATFMLLFLWSLHEEQRFEVTALFLLLFSLSKPDLAFSGMLLGAYLVARPGPVSRNRRAAVLIGAAAVLVVPGLLFASSYYAQFGGRTWVAFGQHYGELVRPLQVEPAPPGWTASLMYLERGFPGAESVLEAVLAYPRQYAYFVGLSITESAIRLVPTKLILLIPLAAFFFLGLPRHLRITVLLLVVGVVPVVLLSFLHVRYQARLYPLALFVIFAGLRHGEFTKRQERGLMIVLAALLIWQAIDLAPVFGTAYWLPD